MIDYCEIDGRTIRTARVTLRPWRQGDVHDALSIYGSPAVAHWLEPELSIVTDATRMAELLTEWIAASDGAVAPVGRWAITLPTPTLGREVVGGMSVTPFGPDGQDLQMGWQLQPTSWGKGLATEAGHALAHYAFACGAPELFAVVRPHNRRAAALAQRVGMDWVGETDKYYERELQVYRLVQADLDLPAGGVRMTPPRNA
jgi:RimJ/RimL family protein N-acetyltransferase